MQCAFDCRPALTHHAVKLCNGNLAAAADLVQETYLRWWERPPQCSKPSKVKGWLIIVMRNLQMDHFRHPTVWDSADSWDALTELGGTPPIDPVLGQLLMAQLGN
jgi:DNA-directed RNA polymerase specialized sigma24 family protein